MKLQPDKQQMANSNDDIQTPMTLARQIVEHFLWSVANLETLAIMEPCAGNGSFYDAIEHVTQRHCQPYCEIKEGSDFLEYDLHHDWIITNPPWSQIRAFLKKSFEVADNVVFLITINHAFTTARFNLAQDMGFGLKEILLVDWPATFEKAGFLLGAVYWQRGYSGDLKITDGREKP